ncbi:hypothetical protein [Pseudogracilibacillus sp. SO30301A]|uniref:hypothetical protein n=1 Tax=Pseudogracilibacillus sp. SO30301A TaxID=3098291 RepID=UPI00300E143E
MYMKRKLDQFTEMDLGLFRSSFESGRQAPKSAARWLWVNVITQVIMCLILLRAAIDAERLVAFKQGMMKTVFLFTIVIIILSIIYSIPYFYKKQEHIQYRILSLGLGNNVISIPYFCGIFMLMQENNIPDFIYFLVAVSLILLGVGMFFMIVHKTSKAIKTGYFSRHSNQSNYDETVQKDKAFISNLPGLIFGGAGLLLIIGTSIPYLKTADGEAIFMAMLAIICYFFGIHIITMNLIAIYCKERFRSFNFPEEGHLYPWGSGDRLENKKYKK